MQATSVDESYLAEESHPNEEANESEQPEERQERREIVLVDTSADDYQQLVAMMFLLSKPKDETSTSVCWTQVAMVSSRVTSLLRDYQDLDAVHLVSHGNQGAVKFGSTWLNSDSIAGYVSDIVGWRDAFAADADMLIYGSDLAGSVEGRTLIDMLALVCDCDVATSDAFTSHSDSGGDWELEYATGSTESTLAFSLNTHGDWAALSNSDVDLDLEVFTETSADWLRHELVFVDEGVQNSSELYELLSTQQYLGRQVEIVVLDSQLDGLAQITSVLRERQNLDAVHLLTHGTAGELKLGKTWLTSDTLEGYASIIRGWSDAFKDDADILIYGCDLAASEDGRRLVQSIGDWTDADVAASSDLTGHVLLGGDWQLEYQLGQLETLVILDVPRQADWTGLLAISLNSTSSAATAGAATSLTWSHTVNSGDNRILTVGLSLISGQSTSVTYGGNAMTLAGRHIGTHTIEIWRLLSPMVGTANIVANFSGSLEAIGGAAAFDGVDQTNPTGVFAGAGTDSGTASVTVASAVGDLVIDTMFVDLPTAVTAQGGQTEHWELTNGRTGAGSTKAGDTSVTMSWTLASADEWDIGAVSLKAAPSGPGLLTVDTTDDYASGDGKYGDTSSIAALLADKGSDGLITLREAIDAANNTANGVSPDEISFNIATSDPGYVDPDATPANGDEYWVITPTSFLGFITDPIILDATTQPGYDSGTGRPVIEIDGSSMGSGTAGLVLRTDDSTIRGFSVHSTPDEGLEIDGSTGYGDNNTLQNNWVGIDAEGNALGNTQHGILVSDNADNNLIGGSGTNDGNVVGGAPAGFSGLRLQDSSNNNVIQGNTFGLKADGVTTAGNSRGITIATGSSMNLIGTDGDGTDDALEGNVISGNQSGGIEVTGTGTDGNVIAGNLIGTDASGTILIGNTGNNVDINQGATNTLVGGSGRMTAT